MTDLCSICGFSCDVEDLVKCDSCKQLVCENCVHPFFENPTCKDCAQQELLEENSNLAEHIGKDVVSSVGEGQIREVVKMGMESYVRIQLKSGAEVNSDLVSFRLLENM